MTNIQPNENGKVKRAQKRLRRHLNRLDDVSNLNAGQRDALFAQVLADLVRLELREVSPSEDNN